MIQYRTLSLMDLVGRSRSIVLVEFFSLYGKDEIFSFVTNDSQLGRVLVCMSHKSRQTLYVVRQIRYSIPHTRTADGCHIIVQVWNCLVSRKLINTEKLKNFLLHRVQSHPWCVTRSRSTYLPCSFSVSAPECMITLESGWKNDDHLFQTLSRLLHSCIPNTIWSPFDNYLKHSTFLFFM